MIPSDLVLDETPVNTPPRFLDTSSPPFGTRQVAARAPFAFTIRVEDPDLDPPNLHMRLFSGLRDAATGARVPAVPGDLPLMPSSNDPAVRVFSSPQGFGVCSTGSQDLYVAIADGDGFADSALSGSDMAGATDGGAQPDNDDPAPGAFVIENHWTIQCQ